MASEFKRPGTFTTIPRDGCDVERERAESFFFAQPGKRHSVVEYLRPRVRDAVPGAGTRSCG
jgi:hypothetical protein